jgi:hypothetical protein
VALKGKLEQISDLLQQQLIIAPPKVDEVQLEVRTGAAFRADPLMALGVPELFGEFIVEWIFDVAASAHPKFQEALEAAEKVLGSTAAGADRATMPRGVRYLGTYLVMSGDTFGSGRYRTLWGIQGWSAYQAFCDRARDTGSEFAQALHHLTLHQDRSSQMNFGTTILQRAAGLRGFWEEAPKKPPAARQAGTRTRRARVPRRAAP